MKPSPFLRPTQRSLQFIWPLAMMLSSLLTPVGADASPDTDISDTLASMPSCGVQCVLDTASAILASSAGCSTDGTNNNTATCLCDAVSNNSTNLYQVQTCLSSCSATDALATLRIVADTCHWPVRSRKASLLALFAIQVPALLFLILRLYARCVTSKRLAVDDYLVFAVVPVFLAFLVMGQYACVIGFGVDIWTVSPGVISTAMKSFYIDEALYIVLIALTKLSLLALYLRIFANHEDRTSCRYRAFRAAAWTIVIWVILSVLIFLVLDIFQCRPIDTVWTRWTSPDPLVPSAAARSSSPSCFDINALAIAAAACSIAQDMAILILPLPLLLTLKLPTVAATATAVAMFSLGIFVLMTSCIRLRFLVRFARSANPTWDDTDSLIWSGLEVSVSIMVISLPSIRVLIQQMLQDRRRRRLSRQQWEQHLPHQHHAELYHGPRPNIASLPEIESQNVREDNINPGRDSGVSAAVTPVEETARREEKPGNEELRPMTPSSRDNSASTASPTRSAFDCPGDA